MNFFLQTARAMRFALFPEERDRQLLEKFTHEISYGDAFPSLLEAQLEAIEPNHRRHQTD